MNARTPCGPATWAIAIAIGFAILAPAPRAGAETLETGPDVLEALVRIDVSAATPDPASPWQRKGCQREGG